MRGTRKRLSTRISWRSDQFNGKKLKNIFLKDMWERKVPPVSVDEHFVLVAVTFLTTSLGSRCPGRAAMEKIFSTGVAMPHVPSRVGRSNVCRNNLWLINLRTICDCMTIEKLDFISSFQIIFPMHEFPGAIDLLCVALNQNHC